MLCLSEPAISHPFMLSTSEVILTHSLTCALLPLESSMIQGEAWKERGFPGGSDGKESACDAGDLGSIPGLGRSSGERNGYTFWYSCLENPHGQRILAGYSPWGCQESDTMERLTLSLLDGEAWKTWTPRISVSNQTHSPPYKGSSWDVHN